MSTHDEVPPAATGDDPAVVSPAAATSAAATPDSDSAVAVEPVADTTSTTAPAVSAEEPAGEADDATEGAAAEDTAAEGTDADGSADAAAADADSGSDVDSDAVDRSEDAGAASNPADESARRPVPKTAGRRASAGGRAPASPLSFSLPKINVRHWLSTTREGVGTLLARPLTSFHLVLLLAVALTGFGLLMVLSASSVEGFAKQNSAYGAFLMQAVYAVGGWILFYLVLRMPIRFYRKFSLAGLVLSIVLLILVLVPNIGVEQFGARRWFELGGISVQPSEIAKLMLCVWGAHVLSSRRSTSGLSKDLFLPLLPVAMLVCILLMLEPNLSTTIIVAVIVAALLWFSGLSMSVFVSLVGLIAAGAVVAALAADYRAARVFSFLGSSNDALGSGYQALQAKYALANGGVFGVGLGQSTAKWNYLPNAHNDFIFAIIGEELGLFGALTTVGLFLLLAYVGMRIARRSADPFLRLLSASITTLITVQMFINVGYVIGLLPVTGIQLPLLSQGGTSMLTMMTMMGLLATAARHEPDAVVELANTRPRGLARILKLPAPAMYRPAAVGVDRLERRRAADRPAGPSSDRRGSRGQRSGPPPGRSPRVPQPAAGTSRGGARRRGLPPLPGGERGGALGPAAGPRARSVASDEIHYSARQASTPNSRERDARGQRRPVRGRAPGAPRRMENRNR
ncbi:MAG: putative lipid II flippase FtsW [Gordonia sp. (in: high G+C Gram-positive bacteria)]